MTNNTAYDYADKFAGRDTPVDPEHIIPYRGPKLDGRCCANDDLAPDPDASLEFLKVLRPAGAWVLTAIVPDGPTTTRTFEASDEAGVRKFIVSHNATENVYFTGNLCGRVKKKPAKADMTGAIFLHTDDDPREGETPDEAKARILAAYDAHDPPPSIIIDSGNGLQGFWLFQEDYQLPEIEDVEERVAEIELRNKALAKALGTTPGTHNIERLLRLPGTVNHPNKAKLKKGRVACMARVVRVTDARYWPANFDKADADHEQPKAEADEKSNSAGAELPPSLRALLYIPDPGANNHAGGYPTRSHLMFAFVTMALRQRVDRGVIARACLDQAHRGCAIHQHCADNGGAEYVERQIKHAEEKIKEASPSLIIEIARRLWGEATSQRGEEHRFGTKVVNARGGWWYDFDTCEGGFFRELMRKASAAARAADVPAPILRWHGDADPLKDAEWLIQDLLPETAFGLLSGQWGTYKTFVALDIATCVMTEQPFLRFPTRTKGRRAVHRGRGRQLRRFRSASLVLLVFPVTDLSPSTGENGEVFNFRPRVRCEEVAVHVARRQPAADRQRRGRRSGQDRDRGRREDANRVRRAAGLDRHRHDRGRRWVRGARRRERHDHRDADHSHDVEPREANQHLRARRRSLR